VTHGAAVARVTRRGDKAIGSPRAFATGGLLTVSEVAASMRVSNMTVYRLIKSGDLAAVRIGHNFRIREADVERYLAARSVRVEGA
jgi:excisionase family DNA binding protein